MTTTRNPTPQGISALLKRAGFTRSEPMERSGRNSGFLVNRDHGHGGTVRVRHYFRMMGADQDGSIRKEKLAAYTKTITEAGWAVEAGEHELIVTAAPEQEDRP